jgi:hypothetical protein
MPLFNYRIWARQRGAIGIWRQFTGEVEADDKLAAHLKLYETYDHIHGWEITPKETTLNGQDRDLET